MGIASPLEEIDFGSNETCGLIPANDVFKGNRCKCCGSESLVKWGKQSGQQKYKCKDCGKYQLLNGNFHRMKTGHKVVSIAIELYYSGCSLKKVVAMLKRIYGVVVARSTVLRWIEKYVPKMRKFLARFKADEGGVWSMDETVVKAGGNILWHWEIVDEVTKFVLYNIYTESRRVKDARKLIKGAKDKAVEIPTRITCDKLPAYERAVYAVFGHRTGHNRVWLERNKGPGTIPSNVCVERFHNTLKARTKVMRGLQNLKRGKAILDGFVIFYNFLRPHESLGERTPAQATGIDLPLDNGFADLISYSMQMA